MKKLLSFIAVVLILGMLAGCVPAEDSQTQSTFTGSWYLPMPDKTYRKIPREMAYSRPDMEEHDRVLEESCRIARTEEDLGAVVEAINDYYDAYYSFYAAYNLAYIHYCADITDTYWEEEYDFCAQNSPTAAAGLERLYCALAESPVREELEGVDYFGADFFDAYEGESVWDDPILTELLERETVLVDEYYAICQEASAGGYYSGEYSSACAAQLAQVFVELIAVRQELAAYFGYSSYPEFAYECYHYRDYTPAQAEAYLQEVGVQLGGLYANLAASDVWDLGWESCTQEDIFAYVEACADAMGGDVAAAFAFLKEGELYDISYSENKYPVSFETYIQYYYQPYIFLCPEGTVHDKLNFSHEFGHFVSDYACDGSYAGTDVAEVHSQAMEYLSLFYGEDTGELEQMKMADSLCTYVEQAAYALFELRAYALEGEALTVENVQAVYTQTCREFGFEALDWEVRDYVTVPHLFVQPMYVVSYVVSNDVAMQIYQMEKEASGTGLKVFEECIYSNEGYIVAFAEDYGLGSPFAPGRLEAVKKTFEEVLGEWLAQPE